MTVKLSIGLNSMKFRVSLLAKHWTHQTLNGCINAAVVILPIEKYKFMLKSSFNIQHEDIVDVKFFVIFVLFFAVREWNDRQTVDESNSIKSKTTFVCEHTTYLTPTRRVNTYLVILSNEKLNSLRGPFIVVASFPSSLPNFFTATNSKDRQTIDGVSSAKCRANFLGLLAEY